MEAMVCVHINVITNIGLLFGFKSSILKLPAIIDSLLFVWNLFKLINKFCILF